MINDGKTSMHFHNSMQYRILEYLQHTNAIRHYINIDMLDNGNVHLHKLKVSTVEETLIGKL
jgi:hypothetical protein